MMLYVMIYYIITYHVNKRYSIFYSIPLEKHTACIQ